MSTHLDHTGSSLLLIPTSKWSFVTKKWSKGGDFGVSLDIIGLMNGPSFSLANLLHYLSIAISQLRTKEVMMAPICNRG